MGLLEPLKKRCLLCSVVRTRVLPGCGATGRFAFEFSRKGVVNMQKSLLRSRLGKIILNLDKIICAETEQTDGLVAVKKCRDDLRKILIRLKARKKHIDTQAFIKSIYRLIECVHFFITGKIY